MNHNLFYRCNCCSQVFDLRIQVEAFVVNLNLRCLICGCSHNGILDLSSKNRPQDIIAPILTNADFMMNGDSFMTEECDIFEISASNLTLLPHKGIPGKELAKNHSPYLRTMNLVGFDEVNHVIYGLNKILEYRANVWPKIKTIMDILHYSDVSGNKSFEYINSTYFLDDSDFDHNYVDCYQELICYITKLKFYWSNLITDTDSNKTLINSEILMELDSLEFRNTLSPIISEYIKPGMFYNGFNLLDRWLAIVQDLGPTLMSKHVDNRDNYTNVFVNVSELMQLYVDTYEFCGLLIRPIQIENALIDGSYDESKYLKKGEKLKKGSLFNTTNKDEVEVELDLPLVTLFKSNFDSVIRNSIGHYDFDVDEVKSVITFHDRHKSKELTILEFSDCCCSMFDSFIYALFVLLEFGIMEKYIDGLSLSYNKENKVGRNELCPCHSLKKYKKCHGQNKNYKG